MLEIDQTQPLELKERALTDANGMGNLKMGVTQYLNLEESALAYSSGIGHLKTHCTLG